LQIFDAKHAEKGKKLTSFHKCVLEFHFESISGLGGSILSTKVIKSVYTEKKENKIFLIY
jgi:hypothetical protein